MGDYEALDSIVRGIVNDQWDIRDGRVVPTTADIAFSGGGVKLEPAMFYADLADSTELLTKFDRRIVAKIYKAFLTCASRLIKSRDGSIRSFDGDRVLGVFLGDLKCSNAVKCALQLNHVFTNIIVPIFTSKYAKLFQSDLDYSVGIDVGDVLVVRGGVYKDNDLLWVGSPANVAAKLSSIRDSPYRTFITPQTYARLSNGSKLAGSVNMWVKQQHFAIVGVTTIYKSSYSWKP